MASDPLLFPTTPSLNWLRRPIFAARLASAAVCLAACGPPPVKATVPEAPAPIPLVVVDGTYAWTQTTTADGIARTETETWVLASRGTHLSGDVVRRVVFAHTSGGVFACSQSSAFALETRYKLSGTRDKSGATLSEDSAEPVASPCSNGSRPLSSYVIKRSGDTLVADSQGVSQVLAPSEAQPLAPPTTTIAGAWQWQMTTIDDAGVSRIEREVWDIEQTGDTLRGHYERKVTLQSDAPIACAAGGTTISITDKYAVSGWIRPAGAEISELAVEAAKHPCAPSARRHLDVAKATVFRDHLVLFWRGDRRQVLSRPL